MNCKIYPWVIQEKDLKSTFDTLQLITDFGVGIADLVWQVDPVTNLLVKLVYPIETLQFETSFIRYLIKNSPESKNDISKDKITAHDVKIHPASLAIRNCNDHILLEDCAYVPSKFYEISEI